MVHLKCICDENWQPKTHVIHVWTSTKSNGCQTYAFQTLKKVVINLVLVELELYRKQRQTLVSATKQRDYQQSFFRLQNL